MSITQQTDPGAAIVRQWNCDPDYFLTCLAQRSVEEIFEAAAAAVSFHQRHGSDLTIDQQLTAWQRAAEARLNQA